ncbi:MAG TPA: PIG-L family deacetylase [Anaerolineae bacterium]|nr:PIG-L family deacetylase [Anaerolineae bacterium]
MLIDTLTPQRALAIVAHPDDIEYYCGGTISRWVQNGATVSFVVTTSGDKGSQDINADIDDLIRVREQEQRDSGRTLGVEDITFLRYPDSELSFVDHKALRGEFVRHIRRTRPEVILTHDPFVRFKRQHADHRIVGQLALDAAFPISTIAQCYRDQIVAEGLSPWQPGDALLFGTDQPTYISDIAATIEVKVKALLAHQSQQSAFAGGMGERLHWRARTIAEPHGLVAAEEFLHVQLGVSLPESS